MKKWTRANYTPCLPLGDDGRRVTGSREHIEISRKVATEGMVLLKNNNDILPLKDGKKVVVFGKGQYDYVKGGGGSGNVIVEYVRNIYDGLKIKESEGKIKIFDGLIDYYKQEMEKQYAENINPGSTTEPTIPDDILAQAKEYSDTAIISICRFSCEGKDRLVDDDVNINDFYLTDEEKLMVETVTDNFDNVIVIINAGAQIDTEWFHNNDKISSVLYAWQAGIEGGLAIADIICGDVNPSGKLVDTFAKSLFDYPSTESFVESVDYTKYYEDIYVGYRYFETIPDADKLVNYSFGFGLSYTNFEISNVNVKESDDKIKISADVKNVGKVPGKEVVQVYYSAPQGKLGKPKFELAAFAKTKELQPDEACTLNMEFDIDSMSSYDDVGKVKKSAYVLEKGTYNFYIGNSVRNTVKSDFEYIVSEDRVVLQLTQQSAPSDLEKRMLSDGTFEKVKSFKKKKNKSKYPKNKAKAPEEASLIDVFEGRVSLDEFIAMLSDDDLIELTYGKLCTGVADTCGIGYPAIYTNTTIHKYGIPNVMTADGPAGLRVRKNSGVTTTAFPCATLIACTWDTDLMYEVGKTGAREVKENNIGIWLTPALNIHRNPLCGRNFEYFSEDPLVSGKFASAKVKGIQSENISSSVKHYCANNKEINRKKSDSIMSERALREIYLKGFEICVKESDPWAIMTSYNLVNGTKASESYDLITNILRGEWGYNGVVMSDWHNEGDHTKEIKAGNDVKMPDGDHDEVAKSLKKGDIKRQEIEMCAKRVLQFIMKLD